MVKTLTFIDVFFYTKVYRTNYFVVLLQICNVDLSLIFIFIVYYYNFHLKKYSNEDLKICQSIRLHVKKKQKRKKNTQKVSNYSNFQFFEI